VDAYVFAIHCFLRWALKAGLTRDEARDGLVEILGGERLAAEPIGNVVKHLHVLRKQARPLSLKTRAPFGIVHRSVPSESGF
jgi:hypothetical protein